MNRENSATGFRRGHANGVRRRILNIPKITPAFSLNSDISLSTKINTQKSQATLLSLNKKSNSVAKKLLSRGETHRFVTSRRPRVVTSIRPGSYEFEVELIKAGVLFPRNAQVPSNYKFLRDVLGEVKDTTHSLYRQKRQFDRFSRACSDAKDENEITAIVLRELDFQDLLRGPNEVFNNVCMHHPISPKISSSQPDRYCGEKKSSIPFSVSTALLKYIQPSTSADCLLAPNFFLEFKGPKGTAAVCKRQAFHNGAIGAQAMHMMRQHIDIPEKTLFDAKAYTITITIEASTAISIYSTHVTQQIDAHQNIKRAPENSLSYHIVEIGTYHLRSSVESFVEGLSALSNAHSWARRQRRKLLSALQSSTSATRSTRPPKRKICST
ncbi:hypothetical protein FH972_021586 [Carpinus fangiana]|uniref:Uncharacterized protein n=1 Tax=Carpinus fangiana TaxID=176857 RepID=A0A5N6KQC8_9ROSI|nr:hypothetical protein FH972_021586 [Carpinus fangiana]